MFKVPDSFKERYCKLVDQPEAFLESLAKPLPKTFRVNSLKAVASEMKERMARYGVNVAQLPWYEDAFVSDSLDIGATMEHFTGMLYIQELVSMLPPIIIRKELEDATIVLDACAAPGSKTTEIAAIMRNRGTLVANDLDYSRIRALKFNLEKCGAVNTVITNYDLNHMPKDLYDAIILDAPCSSEGTIRKHERIFESWSPKQFPSYSGNQKTLILKAFDLLKEGGTMVYSTCTFAPEENETVVDHLLKERKEAELHPIAIEGLRLSKGVPGWDGREYDPRIEMCARIWPHHNDTGGFFMAKVTK